MKNAFKNYGDWILGSAGFLIFALIVWVFIWGMLLIAKNMTQAFGSLGNVKNNTAAFHLDQAQDLDFKGLQ
jgi:hypothetical protein